MDTQTTTVFRNNYNSKKKININRGGTRSGKTYNLLELFFHWLRYGKIDEDSYMQKGILTICRKYASTLKGSVQRDFEEIIDKHNFRQYIDINKQDRTYKHKGRVIEFIGADDQQKLRGGKRDILYCNEGNELSYRLEFFQLLIRTRYKVFIDFNPDDEGIWINTELEQKRRLEEKDVRVIVSTYKDNPYLEYQQVQEIERLQSIDPQYWKIYGLGQYGKLEGLVFNNWQEIDNVPKEAKLIGYGLDFGYSNDPTTLNAIYKYNDDIITDELIYRTGLTNQDIIAELKEIGVDRRDEIFGDCSEPKSIEEIHRGGFNIKAVQKGPDSIRFGLDLMKQVKILVTKRSFNTKKEFKNYSRAKDKNGNLLKKPCDTFNHSIDGIRYLFMMKLKKHNKLKFIMTNL